MMQWLGIGVLVVRMKMIKEYSNEGSEGLLCSVLEFHTSGKVPLEKTLCQLVLRL